MSLGHQKEPFGLETDSVLCPERPRGQRATTRGVTRLQSINQQPPLSSEWNLGKSIFQAFYFCFLSI